MLHACNITYSIEAGITFFLLQSCMAHDFPTGRSVAHPVLRAEFEDRIIDHIGRILFFKRICAFFQCFANHCNSLISWLHAPVSLCCEPFGKSWGKDSKLLCSICVLCAYYRKCQSFRIFTDFQFQNQTDCLTVVLLLLFSWWLESFNLLSTVTHLDLGSLLAPSAWSVCSQGWSAMCLVIASATCQHLFWIYLLPFPLCDHLISWTA